MMDARRAEIWLEGLKQPQLDRLFGAGVMIQTLFNPTLVTATRGRRAHDGRFDYDPRAKPDWLAFEEPEDFIFWRLPQADFEGEVATAEGRAFALGEQNISNPGTYALDGWLRIFPEPFSWLRARRRGIVIIDWNFGRVFEELRDCPRIVGETELLAERIDMLMHPARLPAIAARQTPRKPGKPAQRGQS
jgi:hypothetical protein